MGLRSDAPSLNPVRHGCQPLTGLRACRDPAEDAATSFRKSARSSGVGAARSVETVVSWARDQEQYRRNVAKAWLMPLASKRAAKLEVMVWAHLSANPAERVMLISA